MTTNKKAAKGATSTALKENLNFRDDTNPPQKNQDKKIRAGLEIGKTLGCYMY